MKNTYTISGDVATVRDSKGNEFLIDTEDLERIKVCTWCKDNTKGYVKGTVEGKKVTLHRYLLGFPQGIVDHINRNKDDNRKCNLRICTMSESNRNRGVQRSNKIGIKGVAFCQQRDRQSKYKAQINVDGRRIFLGWHRTKDEAKKIYDEAAKKYFGEFAPA